MRAVALILGSALLATCGLPELVHAWTAPSLEGLSPWFLIWWGTGEVLLFWWAASEKHWPLAVNYGFNTVVVLGILAAFAR